MSLILFEGSIFYDREKLRKQLEKEALRNPCNINVIYIQERNTSINELVTRTQYNINSGESIKPYLKENYTGISIFRLNDEIRREVWKQDIEEAKRNLRMFKCRKRLVQIINGGTFELDLEETTFPQDSQEASQQN